MFDKKTHILKVKRTKIGKITYIYYSQVGNSKRKGRPAPNYTKQELIAWCMEQDVYHQLHKIWKHSGYNTKLSPSCDRIDDSKSYTLDNLQLMTWEENDQKGRNGGYKAVNQYTKTGEFIKTYISIREAARQIGGQQSNIVQCCLGRYKSAKGYVWKYKK